MIIEQLGRHKDYRVYSQGVWLLQRIYENCPQVIERLSSDAIQINSEIAADGCLVHFWFLSH